jgi:hypothetical protein
MAQMKFNEIQLIFDNFPKSFNNIYLKTFGLLQNLAIFTLNLLGFYRI